MVGVLVNKGAGKTGKEMIPNSKFWSDLPGLIAVRAVLVLDMKNIAKNVVWCEESLGVFMKW